MIKKFNVIVVYLLFLLSSLTSFSQVKHKLESWSGLKIDVELLKKLEFKMDGQIRFDENLTRRKSSLLEFGLAYDPFKWLKLTPMYRITRTGDVNEDFGRLGMDVAFDFELWKKWSIGNRTRGQFEYFYNRVGQEVTLRNKTQLDYNLSKLFDPYTAIEFFYSQNKKMVNGYRFRIGGSWRINKDIDLKTFYNLDSQMGRKTNNKDHIIGIYIKVNINAKKKKKKKK